MSIVPGDAPKSKVIPRVIIVPRHAVVVTGASQQRVMDADSYVRFKKRMLAIRAYRKENLSEDTSCCAACGWQAPSVFRSRARDKGSLTFLSVHHLVPYAENGGEEAENLLPLCPTCHEIADHLRLLVSLPNDNTLKRCVTDHLKLIAVNPKEWEKQYNKWNMQTKRRAVDSLRDKGIIIHQPFYADICLG